MLVDIQVAAEDVEDVEEPEEETFNEYFIEHLCLVV